MLDIVVMVLLLFIMFRVIVIIFDGLVILGIGKDNDIDVLLLDIFGVIWFLKIIFLLIEKLIDR